MRVEPPANAKPTRRREKRISGGRHSASESERGRHVPRPRLPIPGRLDDDDDAGDWVAKRRGPRTRFPRRGRARTLDLIETRRCPEYGLRVVARFERVTPLLVAVSPLPKPNTNGPYCRHPTCPRFLGCPPLRIPFLASLLDLCVLAR